MPDFEIEDSLNCMVAGVDEAGRGPWAGPVPVEQVVGGAGGGRSRDYP